MLIDMQMIAQFIYKKIFTSYENIYLCLSPLICEPYSCKDERARFGPSALG